MRICFCSKEEDDAAFTTLQHRQYKYIEETITNSHICGMTDKNTEQDNISVSTGCVYLEIPFVQGGAYSIISTTQSHINDQEICRQGKRKTEPPKFKFDEYHHSFFIGISKKLTLLFINSVIGKFSSHMEG